MAENELLEMENTFRIRHIHDNRINYDPFIKGKPAYRGKNVELRVTIDRTEKPYGYDRADMNYLADKIWTIFIQESNFIKFDMYAPSSIAGAFENTEKSQYVDDRFCVELNYADYGNDLSGVNIKKSFTRSFCIDKVSVTDKEGNIKFISINELYELDEDRFWDEIRNEIRNIINSELTGKPGRIKKVR